MGNRSVCVTISACTPGIKPAERIITLTPENPTVPIGRSSKSPNKGLKSAVDNAWFDSLVMSRNHAKLYLSLENEKVMIRDDTSMHGTILNGEKLPKSQAKALSNGDHLIFGTEVRRGQDTFPQCEFDVFFTFETEEPTKSTLNRAFKFPECVDDDLYSEDDLEDSDNQGSSDRQASSDRVSCESPVAPKISTSVSCFITESTWDGEETMSGALESDAKAGKSLDNAIKISDNSDSDSAEEDDDSASSSSESESEDEVFLRGKAAPRSAKVNAEIVGGSFSRSRYASIPSDESDDGFDAETSIHAASGEDDEGDADETSLDLDHDYPDEQDEDSGDYDCVNDCGDYDCDEYDFKEMDELSEGELAKLGKAHSIYPKKMATDIQPSMLNIGKEISTAEAISRTADKAVFFKAREENRATLEGKDLPFSRYPQVAPLLSRPTLDAFQSLVLPPIRDPKLGIWQSDDDLDMTSAASYHNSKMEANKQQGAYKYGNISLDSWKVPDLASSTSLKRKADQLEEDDIYMENECIEDSPMEAPPLARAYLHPRPRTTAASVHASTETATTDMKITESAPSTVEVTTVVQSSPANSPSEGPETTTTISASNAVPTAIAPNTGRPTKRLRAFVKTVGIAAIGGAIAGAGLFGALVASAPEFI